MAKKLSLATLRGLLGKPADDPEVKEALSRAGKAKLSPDHIVVKEAGFEIALAKPEGGKKKVLDTLFIYPAFGEVPQGFAFTSRSELLATLRTPDSTWVIGKGKVPVDSRNVAHDMWTIDGYDVHAGYAKDGTVRDITIAQSKQVTGSSLSSHPLHFETKPADAVDDAELTGMALLVGWAATRHGLSSKHASSELGKQLVARKITPRAFLIRACNKTLSTLDVAPKLSEFLSTYTHNTHSDDEGARKSTDAAIKKLLRLKRADGCSYSDDFLGTFSDLDNPSHVPDSWDAVERIAPVIEARLADYTATTFQSAPDLKPYEKAVKLRDAVAITAERKTLATTTVDDALAEELIGLVGKSLTDKQVKAVLTRAALPVGKRIDEQANPAIGISYMGAKFDIDGKKVLGVMNVGFYAAKYKTYIRGIGAEVEFMAYGGTLPKGVRIGDKRAEVAAKLGAPMKSRDERDWWEPSKTRRIMAEYTKAAKLVHISFGMPVEY